MRQNLVEKEFKSIIKNLIVLTMMSTKRRYILIKSKNYLFIV